MTSSVRQRKPGIGSLMRRAAWSLRIKLVLAALVFLAIGFGAGWVTRALSPGPDIPVVKPSPRPSVVAASPAPAPVIAPRPSPRPAPSLGIYVANRDRVVAFRLDANGNVTPVVILSGPATSLSDPTGVAFDSAGNIHVSNRGGYSYGKGSVTVYGAGSTGEAIPVETISGPATHLAEPSGIAVDRAGNIYVANGYDSNDTSGGDGSITVYPPHANGNTPPIRRIVGRRYSQVMPHYSLYRPISMTFGSPYLYLLNAGTEGILKIRADSSGQARPLAMIYGASTGLSRPSSVAVDASHEIYVTDRTANTVAKFSSDADGEAIPAAVISGPSTGLADPSAIAGGPTGLIYVANGGSYGGFPTSITVYAPHSTGNAAPVATIAGPYTEISQPSAIAIGPMQPR